MRCEAALSLAAARKEGEKPVNARITELACQVSQAMKRSDAAVCVRQPGLPGSETRGADSKMEPYSGLTDTLARIATASTLPILWAAVKDFAAKLGYSYVTAIDAAKIAGGVANAAMYSDAPRQLYQDIDREMSYAQHPVVLRALESPVPFTMSELRAEPKNKGQRWTELLADVVKRGDALLVPVYDGDEPKAGFSFGGEKPDRSPRARAMLQVVSHAALEKARELASGKGQSEAPSLTVREAQCLRMVAVGKADAEIGETLGISARTVRFHVDSAKVKLGATTRIQAVAKALRARIIAV
jgi:DNA-binding CsgD family transcriptional regulator